LIRSGYPTSYSIWNQLKAEAEKREPGSSMKVMVYKNVNRRVLLLAESSFIEEIKYEKKTPHGRIDYRLTKKGIEELIPYLLDRPEEIPSVIEYLNKSGIDKKDLESLLANEIRRMIDNVDHLYAMAIATDQYAFLPGIMSDFERIASLRKDIERKLSDRKSTRKK
jgi:hypothetical protein